MHSKIHKIHARIDLNSRVFIAKCTYKLHARIENRKDDLYLNISREKQFRKLICRRENM